MAACVHSGKPLLEYILESDLLGEAAPPGMTANSTAANIHSGKTALENAVADAATGGRSDAVADAATESAQAAKEGSSSRGEEGTWWQADQREKAAGEAPAGGSTGPWWEERPWQADQRDSAAWRKKGPWNQDQWK